MNLIDIFRRSVRSQKAYDKEAGLELLKQLESLSVKETNEFDFSLIETKMILQVMLDHQKRLKLAEEAVKVMMSNP